MILVSWPNCLECDNVAFEHPDWEKITLNDKCECGWTKRMRAVKLALHALGHDGAFPCALSDDLATLYPRSTLVLPPTPS
jgi:hypothetical protein